MLTVMNPFRYILLLSSKRICLTTAFMLVCLFAVSLCGVHAQENSSRETKPEATKAKLQKFRMDFVPENALGVLAVRPAQLLAEKAMLPVRGLTGLEQKKDRELNFLGLNPINLETLTIIYLVPDSGTTNLNPIDSVTMLQSTQKIDQKLVREKFSKTYLTKSSYKGKSFLTDSSSDGQALLFLSEKRFLISDNASALKKVIDSIQDQSRTTWAERMQPVETASFACTMNLDQVRKLMADNAVVKSLIEEYPLSPLFAPILSHTKNVSLGITLKQNLSLKISFVEKKNSQEIKQLLQGLLDLAQNSLRQLKETNKQVNRSVSPEQRVRIRLAEEILGATRVTQNENLVNLSTLLSESSVIQAVTFVLPKFLQLREAARISRSKTNIKRIVFALRLYHFEHKRFPPAVVMGPDGKTPHSWRVELLPYLFKKTLYDKYRMNEPWDSKHNRKIAETVVTEFNDPYSDKSTNASYFVVVGPGTAFGNKTGVSLSESLDGTSKTIAVVEAKRNIPWTKPEDLTFDGEKLPTFGGFHKGGYFVGLCDGSVEFFSELTAKDHLKNLLLIKDGQPAP